MSTIFRNLRAALSVAVLACAGFAVGLSTSVGAVTYAYTNTTFAYDTPSGAATSVTWHASGATPTCTNYPNGDDDWSDINIPFTFTFGGTAYTSVRVYSNGILAFPTDVSGFHRDYTPQALPINVAAGFPGGAITGCANNAVPVNLMLPYWIDIIAGTASGITGAAVKYETLGAAPNRRFVITWDNVALYGNAATRYSFQVALFEGTAGVNNNFRYQYTSGSSTGLNATVGVQLTTADYTQYSFNQAFIDTTNGTAVLWYPANQLAAKGAEYRFDESVWAGTAGEIKDTSGNNQNASKVGLALSGPNGTLATSGGKLCRGGVFTANILNTTIDAVSTPITPANQGSISFWYKSNVAWNAASSDAMLIDASPSAAKPFFLMKTAAGALKFSLTDSAGTVRTAQTSTSYTFAANTWQHIAISWNVRPGVAGTNQTVQQIMLNGALVTPSAAPVRSDTSGTIATLSTIYIGDNRTSGVTPTGGTPNGANGGIDEVYIYAIEINATQEAADAALTRATCTSLDHFHIIHNGELVNCDGAVANITIEAHDVTHALFSLSGTTMQMSTSTGNGNWSSVSTINTVTNGGGGNGSYTFANESTIILGLADPTFETLNINLLSGTITEKSGAAASCVSQDYTFGTTCDANFTFTQSGFIFSSAANGAVATIPTQTAGVSSGTFYLRAVKASTTTKACTTALTGTKPINFAYECKDPATCSGSNLMSINGGTATTISRNNSGSVATYSAVNMTFDANGNAPFTFNFSDVGKITLWVTTTINGAAVNGSSNAFVVKPYSFVLSGIQTTAGAIANPAAASAAGAVFIKAGDPFTATVTAVAQGGAATPNYGKEASPETVLLTANVVGGLGLTGVALTNPNVFGAFTNGVATGTTFAWSEVGIITLTPSVGDADYLGAGDVSGTVSGNVGRFIPYQFALSGAALTNRVDMVPACSPVSTFTYLDEDFQLGFTLTAQNKAGGTTSNYAGAFAKLALNTSTVTTPSTANTWNLKGIAGTTVFASPTRLTPSSSSGTWTTGTAPVTLTARALRAAAPDGPFTIQMGIVPADSDGVTMSTLDLDTDSPANGNDRTSVASVKAYFGRLRVPNGTGSQNRNLALPLEIQAWNGTTFAAVLPPATDVDSCTKIPSSAVSFGNYRRTLTSADSVMLASPVSFTNGRATMTLQKPTAGHVGTYDLAVSLGSAAADNSCLTWTPGVAATAGLNLAYLRGAWCTGGYTRDPAARISFGLYGASDRFVYQRENF